MVSHTERKECQIILKDAGYYKLGIDGDWGDGTVRAASAVVKGTPAANYDPNRRVIAAVQLLGYNKGYYTKDIDGWWGTGTEAAVEQLLGKESWRDTPTDPADAKAPDGVKKWPTYRQLTSFYGQVGTNIGMMEFPYPMRIAWDLKSVVTRTSVNRKCLASAQSIFQQTLDHYGYERIQELRLDVFGGCLNVRKMRGGSSYSTHSWACAIDLDPVNNALRTKAPKALFSQPEYEPFWNIVEAHGWTSLGRKKNMDWMHIQACYQ